MSWHCSQVMVAEYLEQSWQAVELSVPSKSKRGVLQVKVKVKGKGKGKGLVGNDQDYGMKCLESFAKLSHDTYSWKTHQCSLVEDLDEYSETWPRQGSIRNGYAYQR